MNPEPCARQSSARQTPSWRADRKYEARTCERGATGDGSSCSIRPWRSGSATPFAEPTPPQAQGWPAIAQGRSTLILAPDRQRQDADGVPVVHQPADVRGRARPRVGGAASCTSRRSRRWRSISSGTCGRRSPASPTGRRARRRLPRAGDRGADRRHAGDRARPLPARPVRHPDHHARVAVPAPDVERPRGAPQRRHGDHRRDPRARPDQARRSSRAVARAPRSDSAERRRRHCSGSASRPLSARSTKWHAFSAGRPRVSTSSTVSYRAVTIVDTSQKKRLDLTIEVPVEDMATHRAGRGDPERTGGAGTGALDDLDGDSPAAPRAHQRASFDAHLREQPSHRGAAGERAQRARRRDAGAIASRIARAAAADRSRRSAQGRAHPRPGRDLVARARHRHGRDRSGDPDRGAAVGRERHAANRPVGAHHRRGEPRHHRPEVPRRSGGVRRGHPRDARGADREHAIPAQSAGRPRAANRRDGVDGAVDGGRRCSTPCGAPRRSPSSAGASSRASSTCSRDAIRPTTSPIFGRG